MRKLLSLVLAFAMILGLFAFPVSADATTYQQVGQELVGLGVLKGVDEKGTLAEMQNLTREQALVVLTRLMGQEDKALATDAQPGFTDVPAAHWYSPYVAYAKLQGWTNGVSETEFGLGQSVTTKQVVTLMMRALGYEADWSKEDVMKKAQELGLMEGVAATADDAIIRGELFIVMKNTLYTKPMGEKAELIYKLGLAENPIPATLEVVDVKAVNLKEIVVEFNQEVDKDTLKDAFSSVGLNLANITSELEEDGKTVVLTLAGGNVMKNKQVYKITISKVKSLSGLTMEKVTKEFKTEDNEVPKVEKLVVTGPKSFNIVFSEPIQGDAGKLGKVKIKLDGKTGPGASVSRRASRVVEVKTGSALVDGKTYTVLVTGFVDFANYKNIDTELELEYAKVSDAPTVEVVKAEQEYVVFKFNRPVKGINHDNFYHTYSAWKPVATYEFLDEMEKDPTKAKKEIDSNKSYEDVVVRFVRKVDDFVKSNKTDEHPLQVGDVEVNVLGQVGSRKVVDNWGNQLQDTELKVTVTADKEAPVIESVEASGEKELKVMFSKSVVYDKANYEILNENGSKVSGLSFTGSADGKKVTLSLGGVSLVGKTFILNVKNVRDNTINMNKLVGTESFTVTFGDKTFDGIKEAYLKAPTITDGPANLYVVYKEAMDSESATNIKNYKFSYNASGSDQFSVDADTSMYSDSIALLSLSNKTYKDKFQGKTVYVVVSNEVKDIAGNKWSSFTLPIVKVETSSTAPKLVSKNPVVAYDRTHVKMKFDQPLMIEGSAIDATKFEVKLASGIKNPDSVEFSGTLNKEVVLTMKDADKLPTDLAGVEIEYKGTDIQNELDSKLATFKVTAAAKEIKDEIAPEFEMIKTDAAYDDIENAMFTEYTSADSKFEIKLTYTENIDGASLSNQTYLLTGVDGAKYDLDKVSVDALRNNVVVLEFTVKGDALKTLRTELKASLDGDKVEKGATKYFNYFRVAVNANNKVQDMAGNEFASKDTFKVYHEAATLGDLSLPIELSNLKVLITEVDTFLTTDYVATDVPAPAVQGKHYFDETIPANLALKNTLNTELTEAKTLAAATDKTAEEYTKAYNELKAAFDAVKEKTIFVAKAVNPSQAANVKASTAKVDFTNLDSVDRNAANYYVLTSTPNDVYYTQGQAKPNTLQEITAVEIKPAESHIVLVKVEQGKVVAYEAVNLAGKKGELTQATTLNFANGTNDFTTVAPVLPLDLKAVTGEQAISLKTYDEGNEDQFKLEYTQANVDQKLTYQIVEGAQFVKEVDPGTGAVAPVTEAVVIATATSPEFTMKSAGIVKIKLVLEEIKDGVKQKVTQEVNLTITVE